MHYTHLLLETRDGILQSDLVPDMIELDATFKARTQPPDHMESRKGRNELLAIAPVAEEWK